MIAVLFVASFEGKFWSTIIIMMILLICMNNYIFELDTEFEVDDLELLLLLLSPLRLLLPWLLIECLVCCPGATCLVTPPECADIEVVTEPEEPID